MDEKNAKRVIRCTPENAGEFRGLVASWPELNQLVTGLQSQNLFPGLRSLTITLTGSDEWVGKGLGAIAVQNAPSAQKTPGGAA